MVRKNNYPSKMRQLKRVAWRWKKMAAEKLHQQLMISSKKWKSETKLSGTSWGPWSNALPEKSTPT